MTKILVVWMIWLVVMFVLGSLYLTLKVSPDQALFDYIAWSHLQGDSYYVGVAEQNWPGKMLLHELGIRLFGVHFWTFRAIDYALMLVLTIGAAALLRQSGYRSAANVFLFLYPALYVSSGTWMAGQRDIVAAGILLSAAATVCTQVSRQRIFLALAAGALVAIAVLVRPTFLSFFAGLLLLVWVRMPGEESADLLQKWRICLGLVCGFAIPILMVLLGGVAIGALDDFYQQTYLFNLQAYQVPEPRSRLVWQAFVVVAGSWHWISLLAVVGISLWVADAGPWRPLVLAVGVLATVLVSYFVQNKGFEYHLGGLLPILVLLVAVAIDRLAFLRRSTKDQWFRRLWSGLFFVALLLSVGGVVKKISNYQQGLTDLVEGKLQPRNQPVKDIADWEQINQAVQLIRDESNSQDFVLQWGRYFHIPFLAERRSTLRFVSTPALEVMGPGFAYYDAWLAEVSNSLLLKPPSFAIVDSNAVVLDADATGVSPLPTAGPAARIVMSYLSTYRVVLQSPHFIVLRRP